jgi:hypothetical protein
MALGITFSAGTRAVASDLNAIVSALNGDAQVTNGALAAGTTTSSSYANLPSGGSRSVTKANGTNTQLRIQLHASCFVATTGSTTVQFGVLVNGVDYDLTKFFINNTATHVACLNGVVYVTGLAAGSYTVQGRWKRTAGTGTVSTDSGDWINLDVREVI